ncbi:MAG: hypothetical protein C0417_11100 [Chlorobiaceae bacterium]|nr:hypothetical protein [Chlorobiaceae bacterium]
MLKFLFVISACITLSSCSSSHYVQKQGNEITVALDSLNWYLSFPDDDYVVEKEQISSDHKSGYFLFTHHSNFPIDTLFTVSFFIEPIKGCIDAKCCRDKAWEKEKTRLKNHTDVQLSEIGEAATFEYTLPDYFNYRSMNAHFFHEGYWIDMHISRMLYEIGSQQSFVNLVKSIKLLPKADLMNTVIR